MGNYVHYPVINHNGKNMYIDTGLAGKFTQVFIYSVWKKLNRFFGQPSMYN